MFGKVDDGDLPIKLIVFVALVTSYRFHLAIFCFKNKHIHSIRRMLHRDSLYMITRLNVMLNTLSLVQSNKIKLEWIESHFRVNYIPSQGFLDI